MSVSAPRWHRRAGRYGISEDAVRGLGWVWPYWLEQRLAARSLSGLPLLGLDPQPRWTEIGTLGSPSRAMVDERGLVAPRHARWSLDWWIGADDRWHFPSREAGVRQRLVDGTPVIETAMRVPGGDVVHRAFAVPGPDGRSLAVIEVENLTPTPVALALAVRPYGPSSLGGVTDISRAGASVMVSGDVGVVLPREPAHEAAGSLDDGDVANLVMSGSAPERLAAAVHCDRGLAQAAFLVPLLHRASVRFAVPLDRPRRARRRRAQPVEVSWPSLPTAVAVARGWRAQTDHGMRVVLPPGRLADALDANRCYLLLFDDDGTSVRPRKDHVPLDPAATFAELQAALAGASATFTWGGHDRRSAIRFVEGVRSLLVRESSRGLDLCPFLPPAWEGHPLEAHDVTTRHGVVSFALRWHGERPALLWELDRRGRGSGVVIRAPGLDPAWSSTERQGEALLDHRPTAAAPAP
jgi:hypothetical protein